MTKSNQAVFLDRDGTLSIDKGYTTKPEELFIFPGAGLAVARLKRAGFHTVIVTNQSAIGRGMCERSAVEACNAECLRQLQAEDPDAKIDAVCLCPHAPEANCECRKPKPGMIAQLKMKIAFEHSWVVGDKCLDLEFGLNAGLPIEHCLLIQTGEGQEQSQLARERWGEKVKICENMESAANTILGD